MGIFDVFGKKKEDSLSLPPPPMPDMEDHSMELPEPPMDEEPHEPEAMEMHEEPESPSMEMASEPMPMRGRRSSSGPIFVSVQDYQMILSGVTAMKSKLAATDESFKKLHEIKAAQEKQLDAWRTALEDVQRKMTYVDEVLFGR